VSDSYYLHLDESYRGKVIAVGGFICAAEDLRAVEDAWVEMRDEMDLDEDAPLKWNLSQSSAVRKKLDAAGWDNRARRTAMIGVIREASITLLADVIYDERESRRPPLDYYKEALDWLLLRFRNYVTDQAVQPPGPHMVVLDQPSPAPPARATEDPRFSWLVNRETIWYRVYRRAYLDGWRFPWARHGKVHSLRSDGFYPSVVISHAKFNPLLEIADAVAGLSLDFAYYNINKAEGEELPDVDWQDEQFMRVARKFRAKWNGDILTYGFAVFPSTTPAFAPFSRWVTTLCTDDQFASLRGD
jgi:hypothetical protein